MNGEGGSYIKQNEDDAPVLVERTLSIVEAEEKAAKQLEAASLAEKQAPATAKKTKEVVNNVSE